jgi:HK97 family phage portal protein
MFDWLKRGEKATNRDSYLEATMSSYGTGQFGAAKKPENYTGFMQRFTGWVYAAAMTNARGVAGQNLKLYAVRPEGATKNLQPTKQLGDVQRAYLSGRLEDKPSKHVMMNASAGGINVEEVVSHPILDVLNNPTPELDGYSLSILRLINLQITGNSYLHPILSESLGIPIELHPMASNLVEVIPDESLECLVSGYVYGLPNQEKLFESYEVLHERQPNPTDMYYGKGWVSAAIDAIDLLEAMDEYETTLLDNNARPDWAVMVKENLTDVQYQRLEQQIRKMLGGRKNVGKPFIFEGGADSKPMQWSPKDLSFQTGETRKIEVVAAISGVPVSKLKANDPNLASAREGNLGWLRDTILPYLVLDEQFLNRHLVPLFGEYAEGLFLAYDNPVPLDEQAIATTAASDIAAGIKTRNEVRAERGLPPVDGGDELMIPMGAVPLDIAIEQAKNPPLASSPFGSFSVSEMYEGEKQEYESAERKCPDGQHWMPADEEHPEGWCMEGESHEKRVDHLSMMIPEFGTKASIDRGNEEYDRIEKANNTAIISLEKSLERLFSQQLHTLATNGLNIEEAVLGTHSEMTEEIAKFVTETVKLAGEEAFEGLNVPEIVFDVKDPAILRYIERYSIRLSGELSRTTVRQLERIIGRAVADGLSHGSIARQVRGLEAFSNSRAKMIARTETMMVYEESKLEAWEQSGLVKGKKWLLAAGACEFCSKIAQLRPNAIPLKMSFLTMGYTITGTSGGKMLLNYRNISAAPLHPNCRCSTIEILRDEPEEIDTRVIR